jgi:hypothetical protein
MYLTAGGKADYFSGISIVRLSVTVEINLRVRREVNTRWEPGELRLSHPEG